MVKASLLLIGDELLDGRVVNLNQQWLGNALLELNISIQLTLCVKDHETSIQDALNVLQQQSTLIIITGGLGPTTDDCTRQAVAQFFKTELILNQKAKDHIEGIFKRNKKPMANINLRQAYLPASATLLHNAFGTAPGFFIQTKSCFIACLPGVPKEMQHMFHSELKLHLNKQFSSSQTLKQDFYKCFGVGESQLAQQLENIKQKPSYLDILYRAHSPELHVSLRYPKTQSKDPILKKWQSKCKQIIEPYLFSTNKNLDFIDTFILWLKKHNHKLVIAESCTGGLLTQLLCQKPGISDYLLESVITYSNQAKTKYCYVESKLIESAGAVSEECAIAMATGLLKHSQHATVSVAITGIAGPGGGSKDKPVGTVFIAVSNHKTQRVKKLKLQPDRIRIQRFSAYHAIKLCQSL